MEKTQEQIQIKMFGKVEELRVALRNQDGATRTIFGIHCRCSSEVDQERRRRIVLETYTRDSGNGNKFEELVNEISNLFQEFREVEKEESKWIT